MKRILTSIVTATVYSTVVTSGAVIAIYSFNLPDFFNWVALGLGIATFGATLFLIHWQYKRLLREAAEHQKKEGYSVKLYAKHMQVYTVAMTKQHAVYRPQLITVSAVLADLAGFQSSDGLFKLLDIYVTKGDTRAAHEVITILTTASVVVSRK